MRVSIVVADVGREAATIRDTFADLAVGGGPHEIRVSQPAPIRLGEAFEATNAAAADLLIVSAHGGYHWGKCDGAWRLGPRPSSSDRFPAERIDGLLPPASFDGTLLLFACRLRHHELRADHVGSIAEEQVRSVLGPRGRAYLVDHERAVYNAQARRIALRIAESLATSGPEISAADIAADAIVAVPPTRWWPEFQLIAAEGAPITPGAVSGAGSSREAAGR